MALPKWLVAGLSLATVLLSAPVNGLPAVPRAEESDVPAFLFIDQLIANLTEAAEVAESTTKRGLTCSAASSRTVNLGYAKYQGYADSASGLNVWKGACAALGDFSTRLLASAMPSPTGDLRWQAPLMPPLNLAAAVQQANTLGPACPQALPSGPGMPFIPGDEDCLFLNVYAPSNAQNLPVLVWIHGGGYGFGDGSQDMTEIINANNKGFVVVSIQYRVRSKGVVNAGLLDQALALAWIKIFICQFGGDPTRVTISGESAGASSVMYQGLAYKYDASFNTKNYYSLSSKLGCGASGNVFNCLKGKATMDLQQANYEVTQEQPSGFWAYYPATDNAYITTRATQQLTQKKVNGDRLLVSNVANEGPLFVPHTITTEADLKAWLALEFPNFTTAQINSVLAANPNSAVTSATGPRYETNGVSGANHLQVSADANGQQQRGNAILGESTFVCPSYWMAEAYTGNSKKAYHYQMSVPFSSHATDVAVIFGPRPENVGADYALAVQRIWGNFVTGSNPSITNAIANGASSSSPSASNPASAWPAWTVSNPQLVNLNQTGGVAYTATSQWGTSVTQFKAPGQLNAISASNADTWEGGRGTRCDFWLGISASIPS
ncbi:unnamed protein product [Parascedosporium putredinis]|uniref:Carboxylic ester hydrolase n=1 Tax=Parascedosporium putredinis TaxID=1442378 RepID=A0A9P1MF07_9PEZI|nr:unnamed protein product [Parascedosporium putredinis]CAI8002487.1 unnamed protein product [Parascedosporium putredinis]